jgi:hypothetical protein
MLSKMFSRKKKIPDDHLKIIIETNLPEIQRILNPENINEGVVIDKIEKSCPVCHTTIEPRYISSFVNEKTRVLETILKCTSPSCNRIYIAYYKPTGLSVYTDMSHGGLEYRFYDCKPFGKIEPNKIFSDFILAASPQFGIIYTEAWNCEHNGLNTISGLGFRKAFEFLIKDYCISRESDQKEIDNIKKWQLGKLIQEKIDDPKLKIMSERIAWLGNDQTHYVQKWEDLGLQDLKDLIKIAVNHIDSEEKLNKFVERMPQGK